MKIGLLAYQSAVNFGARLQLLSTFMFLKGCGHEPVIINWLPEDLERFYDCISPPEQKTCLNQFSKRVWRETELCRSSKDVAAVIGKEGIQAVIVGSDAVAKINFPQIVFPCRQIITYSKPSQDRVFPNPFWADFLNYMKTPIPVAVMSASCESSPFEKISEPMRQRMKESVARYSYLSVRDSWTNTMFQFITRGEIDPPITPDPVFAFNHNASSIIPTREQINSKFALSEKYIVLSFVWKSVSPRWVAAFETIAEENGYMCVSLPISHTNSLVETKRSIRLPLTPLDWYAIIANSCGYVGHNMHPVVIAITNNVPFFSFDNYGKTNLFGLVKNDSSSKVRHLLKITGLEECRTSCIGLCYEIPSPEEVFKKLISFNKEKALLFAQDSYSRYVKMMNDILLAIS